RLTQSHTGSYLAQVTADCLKRFGLEKKLHTLTMDNVSNYDATAEHLMTLIDGFCGKLSRSRCFPHTVNLIAKVHVSSPFCSLTG
ncbi:hypothetical protein BDR05DRAFT_876519, partial [Suillus weaverae]